VKSTDTKTKHLVQAAEPLDPFPWYSLLKFRGRPVDIHNACGKTNKEKNQEKGRLSAKPLVKERASPSTDNYSKNEGKPNGAENSDSQNCFSERFVPFLQCLNSFVINQLNETS
jgi:hypothetical protein